MFQGTFKVVSRKFQGCFEGILRLFQGSFNSVEEVLRKCQGRFREVTWMRMWSFQGVSKKFHGCFMKFSSKRKFKWCFEEGSKAIQRSYMDVS